MTILLVDDDYAVRQNILQRVNWQELNIDRVIECEDSQEALLLCHENRPDIIISDVRLPKMTGIELAGEIRKFLPEVKLIMISGFSDREYLKAAIKLHAVDFIEKPINICALSETIKSIVEKINLDQVQSVKTRILEEQHVRHKMEVIALSLTSKQTSWEGMRHYCAENAIDIFDNPQYATIVLKNINQNHSSENIRQSTDLIITLAHQLALLNGLNIVGGRKDKTIVFQVYGRIGNPTIDASTKLQMFCVKLQNKLMQEKIDALFGVGQTVSEIVNLHLSYEQAIAALNQSFFDPNRKINLYRSIQLEKKYDYAACLAEFSVAIVNNLPEKAKSIINLLTEANISQENRSVQDVVSIYYEIACIIYSTAQKQNVTLENYGDNRQQLLLILMNFNYLRELSDFIGEMIDQYFSKYYSNEYSNKTVNAIIRYIKNNYMDPNLAISNVSDVVNLAPNYISGIFKAVTGTSINKYIINTRLEKAKLLLANDHLTTGEIAQMVGLSNGNYLTKLFHKQFGITPSEYKRKIYEI